MLNSEKSCNRGRRCIAGYGVLLELPLYSYYYQQGHLNQHCVRELAPHVWSALLIFDSKYCHCDDNRNHRHQHGNCTRRGCLDHDVSICIRTRRRSD